MPYTTMPATAASGPVSGRSSSDPAGCPVSATYSCWSCCVCWPGFLFALAESFDIVSCFMLSLDFVWSLLSFFVLSCANNDNELASAHMVISVV